MKERKTKGKVGKEREFFFGGGGGQMKEEKKEKRKYNIMKKKNKEWCWATNGARLHSLTNVADFSRHFTAGKFQKTPFFNRETKCLGLNIESLETVNEWCSACLDFSNFFLELTDCFHV